MKKILIVLAVIAGLAGAGIFSSRVFAQAPDPADDYYPGMWEYGMMMGRGGGYLHTYMVSYIADQLGLSVDEINTRFLAGETLYQIAASTGLTDDEIITLLSDARTYALEQAAADGIIPQGQLNGTWQACPGMSGGTTAGGSYMGGRGRMMGGYGY